MKSDFAHETAISGAMLVVRVMRLARVARFVSIECHQNKVSVQNIQIGAIFDRIENFR